MSSLDKHAHMNHDDMDHSNMDHSSTDMDFNNDGHNGKDHSGHGLMQMYFHASSEATILFSGWTAVTWPQMFGSCVAVLIIAVLYEALKVFRERLLTKAILVSRRSVNGTQPLSTDDKDIIVSVPNCSTASHLMSTAHIIQTLLHVLQVLVSYALMLIFMTYNVWLCLAVATGAGLGYYMFGWRRNHVLDRNEHCH